MSRSIWNTVKSAAAGVALAALVLSSLATAQAVEPDSVTAIVDNRTLKVQIAEPTELSKVLEQVCTQTAAECTGTKQTANMLIAPMKLSGDWNAVLATLLQDFNFVVAAPAPAQAGRIVVLGPGTGADNSARPTAVSTLAVARNQTRETLSSASRVAEPIARRSLPNRTELRRLSPRLNAARTTGPRPNAQIVPVRSEAQADPGEAAAPQQSVDVVRNMVQLQSNPVSNIPTLDFLGRPLVGRTANATVNALGMSITSSEGNATFDFLGRPVSRAQ